MNTIIVDYVEVEKSDKTTNFPFMHKFLFDRFRLIMENVLDFGTINTIVSLRGNGTVSLRKYKASNYPDESGDFDGEVYVDDYGSYHGDFCTSCNGGNYNRMSHVFESMKYIMANLEEREMETIVKDSQTHLSVCKSEQHNSKSQKVYLMDDIKRYFYISKPRSGNPVSHIQCPCWSVRGHYRHYKNGKTIFIENYLKGKDREKAKPKDKEYVV